ncbi:MAG: hypothetical protein EA409_02535 [Saprospirales bacterium]|nr:MAG: hypothetical protein EA409_02535 [Saprospirales bacterium]
MHSLPNLYRNVRHIRATEAFENTQFGNTILVSPLIPIFLYLSCFERNKTIAFPIFSTTKQN